MEIKSFKMPKIPKPIRKLIEEKTKIFPEKIRVDNYAHRVVKHRALSVTAVEEIVKETMELYKHKRKRMP